MNLVRSATAIYAALILLISIFSGPCYGSSPAIQQRRMQTSVQAPNLSADQKARLTELAGERIREVYAFPEEVPDIQRHLNERLSQGAYDDIEDGSEFAAALTGDLRSFTDDPHFAVMFDPNRFDMIDRMGAGPNPSLNRFQGGQDQMQGPEPGSPQYDMLFDRYRRTNFNFRELEILDGNVGYLRLGTMPPLELARPTVDATMQFLAYSDAVIIDLRGVPGGVGGFIPYLMSYFFPPDSLLLFERVFPYADHTERFRTWRELPAPRLDEQPVYILVDAMTGSAAENLAYTLQQHGRATVVGEATAGGAHSSSVAQLENGFVIQLPIARVVHPVSGSNWDRTGVQPDIEAGSSHAMEVAYETALTELVESANANTRSDVEAALDRLRSSRSSEADAMTASDFSEYAGTYGTRTIIARDGGIRYQREGGPQVRLARIEGDLFRFDLDPNMRPAAPLPTIRFDRNDAGDIVSISALDDDGTVRDVFERTN